MHVNDAGITRQNLTVCGKQQKQTENPTSLKLIFM